MTATNALTTIDPADMTIAAIAATSGDLSKLSPEQRTQLYGATCRSVGLNPLTQPFLYLTLNGKMVLYAAKGCTDQLRQIYNISFSKIEVAILDGILTITVDAQNRDGRTDTDIGAVSIVGLKGDALANAHMKAVTKAKRRVTLSICGLGLLDETEISSIPGAQTVTVDQQTGEIMDTPSPPRQLAAARDDHEAAMRALHAEAAEHGITHDQLHAWARRAGVDSLRDLSAGNLVRMRERIQRNPEGSRDWFSQLATGEDAGTSAIPADELGAINQAIDAELAAQKPLGEVPAAEAGDKTPAAFR